MTAMPVRPEDLSAAAWAACATFIGTLAPADFKDQVLALFFLKYLSDLWQDRCKQHHAAYGAHPELVEELLKHERFVLPPDASFHRLYESRHAPGTGERIDSALLALEAANPAKLGDVFREISFSAVPLGDEAQKNISLRQLLYDFGQPDLDLRVGRLGTRESIGPAYEGLIRRFACACGKRGDEFYTAPEVAQLMAQLVDPAPGEEICDPACGSGSLLLACARLAQRSGGRRCALYGQEVKGSTWALAKMNLFLHEEDNHCIEWGDTLRNPKLLDARGGLKQFDVVVAHPPLLLDNWRSGSVPEDRFGRFRRGLPPRTKADYAFILHMVETMKAGSGRMAVLVPHGVLFRGATEARIRRKLIEENLLDLVIGLPEKLFYSTGIPAAVLVLRRTKRDDKVLFVSGHGCQSGKNQNLLRPQDLQRILQAVRERRSVDGYACLASAEQIARNDFNLNLSRYVARAEPTGILEPVALSAQRLELQAELAGLQERLAAALRALQE